MELNEEQINRLLAIIDSKVAQAVATQLSALIPSSSQQTAVAFEEEYMKGYNTGAPLQQGTFREFLRRCTAYNRSYVGTNDITVTLDTSTNTVTISGLTLKTAIAALQSSMTTAQSDIADLQSDVAALPSVAFKSIGNGTTDIVAASKSDKLSIISTSPIFVSVNQTTKEITISLSLGSTQYGGNNKLSLQPATIPYFSDEIVSDCYYSTKYIDLRSTTPTVNLEDLSFPKNEFIIISSVQYDITSYLNSLSTIIGMNVLIPQSSIIFKASKIYRFTTVQIYDVTRSRNALLAYYEEI